jgi:hypothetical protein
MYMKIFVNVMTYLYILMFILSLYTVHIDNSHDHELENRHGNEHHINAHEQNRRLLLHMYIYVHVKKNLAEALFTVRIHNLCLLICCNLII